MPNKSAERVTISEAGNCTGPASFSSLSFTCASWVELSKRALENNITQYKKIVGPDVVLAPVIKANAYGHGMQIIAQLLDTVDSIGLLCVAKLSEALTLRHSGIKKPILVLSIVDADPAQAVLHSIALVVWDEQTAHFIDKIAQQLNRKALLHIKVDTGLSRLGVLWNQAESLVHTCATLKHCIVEGIFTHFSNSESSDLSFTKIQICRFNQLLQQLTNNGISFKFKHCACSASQTVLPTSHMNLARLGIGLYGLWPSPENKEATARIFPSFSLKPVLEWKTRINAIKTIPAESFVGYSLAHQVARKTRIAILPIGYADGYNRLLSNKGVVKIRKRYAPVIGRVAMNLTIVDITHIQEATLEDEVLLLGDDPQVNAQTLAMHCGTINYDIVTNIAPDLVRTFIG